MLSPVPSRLQLMGISVHLDGSSCPFHPFASYDI